MKIKLTEFALRHFDKNFGGTKILDKTPEEFENQINTKEILESLKIKENIHNKANVHIYDYIKVIDGYESFCKLMFIRNFTDAKVGSLPITLENYQYIRSGYSARTTNELPVFSRWLELPLDKPKAEWLCIVLYSKEQIDKEAREDYENNVDPYKKFYAFDADYGIVAILGQSHDNEEPMKPETLLRNSGYGITDKYIDNVSNEFLELIENSKVKITKEVIEKILIRSVDTSNGGSGVKFDKEAYLKSVAFWENNLTVK